MAILHIYNSSILNFAKGFKRLLYSHMWKQLVEGFGRSCVCYVHGRLHNMTRDDRIEYFCDVRLRPRFASTSAELQVWSIDNYKIQTYKHVFTLYPPRRGKTSWCLDLVVTCIIRLEHVEWHRNWHLTYVPNARFQRIHNAYMRWTRIEVGSSLSGKGSLTRDVFAKTL